MSSVIAGLGASEIEKIISTMLELFVSPGGQAILGRIFNDAGITAAGLSAELQAAKDAPPEKGAN